MCTNIVSKTMWTLFVLVTNFVLIQTTGEFGNNVHYIVPLPNVQCPKESCLTLSTLAANSTRFIDTDTVTTIIFLEGNHTLDSQLTVSDIYGSLMLLTNGTVAIFCSDEANLDFYNIARLRVAGIEFTECSCNVGLVGQFALEDSRFYSESNNSALQLVHTNANIVRSLFVSNTAGTYKSNLGVLVYMINNRYDFPYGDRPDIRYTNARVGGAIIVTNSTVEISTSNFENNSANVGGAIFTELGSNLRISNCTLVNNSATGCRSPSYNSYYDYYYSIDGSCLGGAIFVDNGSFVTAQNSMFIDNSAGYSAGAIALFLDSEAFLGSSQNVFCGNRGDFLGGAVAAFERSRVTINSGYYSNNTGRYGGVIYMGGYASTTVSNSFFENNEAGEAGGVINAHSGSSITVDNSSFDNNEAGSSGGVIYASDWSRVTIDSGYYSNNTGRYGGVIYMGRYASITVSNSFFDNNEVGDSGGVVYVYYRSSITVGNSSFDNNEAGRSGGVIYASSSSSITVDNSLFYNNTAHFDAGVMYVSYSGSSITVGNSSFKNNEAGRNGGVVSVYYGSSITVGNSSFDNNEAGGRGGVMYAHSRSSITVDSSSFDNNEAGSSGGVIYASDWSRVTIDSGYYSNNTGRYGGVIYIGRYASITLSNSFFDNNEAGDSGGVVYVYYGSSITVGNSFFDNNEAGRSGGVIYASSSSSITVDNSLFYNNTAHFDAGVMYVSYSTITVDNSLFNNNVAHFDAGVVYVSGSGSSITLGSSSFENNEAGRNGGVMYYYEDNDYYYYYYYYYYGARMIMENITFNCNRAGSNGGVLYHYSINTIDYSISLCTFFYNSASEGGVMYIHNAMFTDTGSVYYGNMADNGGAIALTEGLVSMRTSKFEKNTARSSGGALYSSSIHSLPIVDLESCCFINNSAKSGGAIAAFSTARVTVTKSTFVYNNAVRGGAVYLLIRNNFTANYSNFTHNFGQSDGGMIFSENQNKLNIIDCEVNYNRADSNGGGVALLFVSELNITGGNSFIGNQARSGGVAYARESTINIYGQTLIIANNTAIETGGAVHLSAANLSFLDGHNRLVRNKAHSGGALYATKSRVDAFNDSLLLANNIARDTGGAVYLSTTNFFIQSGSNEFSGNEARTGGGLYLVRSELMIKGESTNITRNRAIYQGGGIHASNSSIIIEGTVHLVSNEAENGGGISLEKSAKLRGAMAGHVHIIALESNKASHYGGALYVNDETNPDMCAVVNMQNTTSSTECFSQLVYFSVSGNIANISGSNLFGGLLDRCAVYNEISMDYVNFNEAGIINILNSSNINESQLLHTVSSHPVQLCFCRDSTPDCNYQPESIRVNRGNIFSFKLIAYNYIHYPVDATIQCSLNSSAGGLGEGETFQSIKNACTELKYNLFTPNNYEELTFSAVKGRCNQISARTVMIQFNCSCPVGFQIAINNDNTCYCTCHQVLQPYEKTECNPTTKLIIRKENFWISYINGYVIYPNCPYDYCYPPDKEISVNLSSPNGSDAQCNSNRMGILCATCRLGLSVSLGSSKCVFCPKYWPGLLVTIAIAFIILGIGLVTFLLLLNLTVAIGTLNAINFYANMLAANQSVLFPSGVSFASVFISWLNFDLGIDVCFFDGMDMYVKTWLQLAFPAYIIVLVVVIVQLSYHFDAFGRYIGKKDPVATLATLILLSYAKLLQTIITAFSTATLVYPDGSRKILWLPDATIEFFTSKHAVLFFTFVLILLAGLVYTFLLFSWQLLLYCPRKRVKWIKNQKLSSFMEVYHIPYVPKHRYWTGLLLLARVGVYFVSAFNPSGDPRVTLLATNFVICSLIVYIATFSVRIYKNRYINIMEVLTYFNITVLSMFTWYTIDGNTNQTILTNVSVGVTFIQVLAVIAYHAYKHANQKLFTTIKECATYIKRLTQNKKNVMTVNDKPVPADEDIHRFHKMFDILDEPLTNNYNIPQVEKKAKPTQSVVELPNPVQASSTPSSLNLTEEDQELQKPPQIDNNYSDTKLAKPVALEMAQSDIMEQSSQEIVGGPKEEIGSHCITVKAEIHDY